MGELPTFVDIGHSFGAPAIVEDNLILQAKFLFELDSVFKNMNTVRKGSSVFFSGEFPQPGDKRKGWLIQKGTFKKFEKNRHILTKKPRSHQI